MSRRCALLLHKPAQAYSSSLTEPAMTQFSPKRPPQQNVIACFSPHLTQIAMINQDLPPMFKHVNHQYALQQASQAKMAILGESFSLPYQLYREN